MDKDISNSVRRFFDRYPDAATMGRLTNQTEIDGLPKKIKDAIPEWYKNLLLQFPIANLPLGIPNDFGQSLLKNKSFESLPLMEIVFHSVDKISELTDSRFPYNLLFGKQFIGIAEDQYSTGEGIFVNAKQDNPNILMVFHDMGESSKELIANAQQLTNSFTDLFDFGKLTNNRIRLTAENKQMAQNLIEGFFSIIDKEIAAGGDELIRKLENPKRLSDSIEQRETEKSKGNYIGAVLKMEYGLNDSGYPLNKNHLTRLIEIYKLCGLHLPELVYIEEQVSNYGG